jgi:uncharacterized phage infection (PIP) family protein YhgE
MAAVKTGVYLLREDLTTTNGNVSTLSSSVSSLSTQVGTLDTTVSTLSNTVSQHTSAISTLQNSDSNQNSSINTLQNQMSTANSNIQNLQTSVGSLTNADINIKNNMQKIQYKFVSSFGAQDLANTRLLYGEGGAVKLLWNGSSDYTTADLNLFSYGFEASYANGVQTSDKVYIANVSASSNLSIRLTDPQSLNPVEFRLAPKDACTFVFSNTEVIFYMVNGWI